MANKSENKFSVGDKVVRIGSDFLSVKVGHVYTVERMPNVFSICLKEVVGEFVSDYFELVEQKEKEMTFKNMKFDVAAIAKELNVEQEEASRIIQEALFEQGYEWQDKTRQNKTGCADYLFANDNGLVGYGHHLSAYNIFHKANWHKKMTIKPTYTIIEAEEQQEVVELNGNKYNKQELEKALSLLKPIE